MKYSLSVRELPGDGALQYRSVTINPANIEPRFSELSLAVVPFFPLLFQFCATLPPVRNFKRSPLLKIQNAKASSSRPGENKNVPLQAMSTVSGEILRHRFIQLHRFFLTFRQLVTRLMLLFFASACALEVGGFPSDTSGTTAYCN